jgi:hypothetical protein
MKDKNTDAWWMLLILILAVVLCILGNPIYQYFKN